MHGKEAIEKDRILEAAMTCFQRFGSDNTTLADIAENLGYSRTKIYYYFKDKESVCKAVLLKMSNAYFKELEQIVHDYPQSAGCLEKLLQKRLCYTADILVKGMFPLELAFKMMETDDELRLLLDRELQLYVKVIRKGIKDGVFSVKGIAQHANLLLDSASGYFHVVASRYRDTKALQKYLPEIKEQTTTQLKFLIQALTTKN